VDYLNSLSKVEANKSSLGYVGGGYTLKVYLKNGIERTLFLEGNEFLIEIDKFAYEIPYMQAIKFNTIVASILEAKESKKGTESIDGNVTSGGSKENGSNTSCVIKTKGNLEYKINLEGAKIIDATGSGNLLVHKDDKIKVFYLEDRQPDGYTIHDSKVFIKKTSN
jgi:hypothetical protein